MTKFLRVLLINLALITFTLLLAELGVRWWEVKPYVRTFPGEYPNGPAAPWARKDP